MFDGQAMDIGSRFLIAFIGVGIGLIALIVIMTILKRRNSALFVRGGKSRDRRLMIIDAAAIDAKRRLVLIRRDNIEHLLMIGGSTDIVIESGISPMSNVDPIMKSPAFEPPIAPKSVPQPTMPRDTASILTPSPKADTSPATAKTPNPALMPASLRPSPAPSMPPTVQPVQQPVSKAGQALYRDEKMPGRPELLATKAQDTQDALDTARQRIAQPMPQKLDTQASLTQNQSLPPQPQITPPVTLKNLGLAADFEQILEAEMVANGISLEDEASVKIDPITSADPSPAGQNPDMTPQTNHSEDRKD